MANQVNDDEAYDQSVRRKFAQQLDSRRTARKGRQKKLIGASDGRSLRETGRVHQINFKAKAEIVEALDKHVGSGRKSMWLEEVIIAALRAEGYPIDAVG